MDEKCILCLAQRKKCAIIEAFLPSNGRESREKFHGNFAENWVKIDVAVARKMIPIIVSVKSGVLSQWK
jgi:hypothetical protein